MTGKVFIPMYFGSDRVRIEELYKGEGRIIYAGARALASRDTQFLKLFMTPPSLATTTVHARINNRRAMA